MAKKMKLSDLHVGDTVKVSVCKEDIRKGKPGNESYCAIARRLSKLFGIDSEDIHVSDSQFIKVAGYAFSDGPEVDEFIEAFDGEDVDFSRRNTKKVKPTTFELTVDHVPGSLE